VRVRGRVVGRVRRRIGDLLDLESGFGEGLLQLCGEQAVIYFRSLVIEREEKKEVKKGRREREGKEKGKRREREGKEKEKRKRREEKKREEKRRKERKERKEKKRKKKREKRKEKRGERRGVVPCNN
jgi:hypothetical protein